MEELRPNPEPEELLCPACGQPITPIDPLVECTNCGNQFFSGGQADEDVAEPEDQPEQTDELDGMRIRQVVHLRRSNIRARSHALIAMLCCGVAAGQLIYTAVHELRRQSHATVMLYFAGALAAVIGTTVFSKKAAVLQREINAAPPPPPEDPPHFEELSDGSQHAKNLDEM